ncbi:coiled-coil domain-containing protein 141 isoform X3 [Varanus komodoensis]|uniref:coiled-coil domain-containing protein 141 isoform X3 n=1 Tax=Varanus komodoensis TaxID=61221 RepID=UPI001CF77DAE|nr:coiled-coil domain-containing protein 141 isoform X3 [Varanus komodoensis]
MASSPRPDGPPSTTTVSSVLVQAGDCRITIAILKCGTWVQLQLSESVPNLLEIGSNQEETNKLLQDHELLLAKLKPLEGQVWDLLREADKTAAENTDQGLVYDAMAETLGDAWDSLICFLEKRRGLLKLTSSFFEKALEFAVKIDQVEDFLRNSQEFETPESLKLLLCQHKLHTKELLQKSLVLLNKSQDLTEFIEEFKSDGPNINPEFFQGAHSSCLKIDRLLEALQDRRRQLDKYLKLQRQGLEQVLHICQWHHRENQVTSWYKKNIKDYFHKHNFGSTLKENEELLQEHKEIENKVKEWNSTLEELKTDALGILFSEDYAEKEHLKLANQKINLLQQEVNRSMNERKTLLQEANDFFIAANKACDILGNVEASLQLLNSEGPSMSLPAMKHEELLKKIQNGSTDALQKGHTLLSKGDTCSSWMAGVQEMVDYIQKKVDQLIKQCSAHKELASKKQHLTTSIDDYLKKASTKIKNIGPILSVAMNPGSSVPESEEVLNKYLELANQTKEMANELELAVRIFKEMEEFETTDVTAFSNKTDLLNEELTTLNRNISLKLEVLKPYVAFLKSSNEVEDDAQRLKKFYITEPLQEDIEAKNEALVQSADVQWQMVLKKILSTQDMGHDFLNLVNMVNDNLILNVENVVQVTEHTIDILNKEKDELTELWTTWKLNMNQVNSIKRQCGKFNEQFKNTTQSLNILQETLKSTRTLDLGSNLSILVELQNTFNQMKPQFQQLNVEVEYTLKLSEQLSLKGVPDMEKSEKVSELKHLHKEIKERMAEYDDIFNKTVRFHHIKEELEDLIKSAGLDIAELKDVPGDTPHAKIHLNNAQEKHAHIRHLYKMVLTLGMDIISAAKYTNSFNVSVKNLQQQLDALENDSINWNSKAEKHEEELSHILYFCTKRDEIHELRESFKDLKKKFNNMKFNYSKKTEKARNLKALKIQIQQVDAYSEKMQVLKKKTENLKKTILDFLTTLPSDKAGVLPQSISELEKNLNEFGKIMGDYKHNLDLMEQLQQMMEECQFWCEEASATVLRVGKYSSECKTREAVEILYKQFNKFVHPIVPQQEERIQQITNLAKDIYGTEEGKKYVEKIVAKHEEVLDSISELCSSLTELEDKLGEDSLNRKATHSDNFDVELKAEYEKQKEKRAKEYLTETTNEPTQMESDTLAGSPCTNKTEVISSTTVKEEKILADISVISPAGEDIVSQDTELLSPAKEDSFQAELLAEDVPSGEEYECISPDDISLPPLSETPESNLLHSETDLEELPCSSSRSLHVSSSSVQMQINTGSKRMADESDPLTSAAYADMPGHRMEHMADQLERFSSSTLSYHSKCKVESPFAPSSPEMLETSPVSCTLKTKAAYCMSSEVCETYLQNRGTHRSMAEAQRQLHDINNFTKNQDRPHALPNTFSDLLFQSDTTRSCQRQMVTREEIKSISEKNSMVSLSGQAPKFSKLLSNVTVMEGSPVTLEVEVTGFPEPTLTWYKKGQKVTGDEHLKLFHKDTKYTLFIQKVCDTDAGLYVVRAKNSSGTVSSSAILHVKVQGKQPNFIKKFGHTTLQEGDDLNLHCTIYGRPRPNVIWTKDGIRVAGREISIEKLGDTYYLLKRNAVLADTGKYICLATNEVGEAHCSAFIRVIEKNKNAHVLTVTETKSKQGRDYLSEKVKAATPEALQGQDSHCLKGQRQTKKHSVRKPDSCTLTIPKIQQDHQQRTWKM